MSATEAYGGAGNERYHLGPHARRLLHVVGTVLFLLSLGYVGAFVARNWHALGDIPRLESDYLVLAATAYFLAHPSSAAAWVVGLRGMGQRISLLTGLRIGFVAQIGKYLPGNVAHYFARAGLASSSGVKLADSGIATLLEILATFLAASLIICSAMLLDPAPVEAVHQALGGSPILPLAGGTAAVVATALLLWLTRIPVSALLEVTACLMTSFVIVGFSFLAVVVAVSDTVPSPAAVIGIYAVAWTVGYFVPGAPAGLGVREAILVAWLGPLIGDGAAIACTLLHRLIAAGMDALVATIGYGWHRLSTPQASAPLEPLVDFSKK